MASDVVQNIISFVQVSNELLRRAQVAQEKTASAHQSAKAAANKVLNVMIEHGLVLESQRDSVLDKLANDHAATLETLGAVITRQFEPEPLGKTANAKPAQRGFRATGATVTDYDEMESGQEFRRMLYAR